MAEKWRFLIFPWFFSGFLLSIFAKILRRIRGAQKEKQAFPLAGNGPVL